MISHRTGARSSYANKLISAEDAVSHIKSDTDIAVAQCASEPQGVMSKFHLAGDQVKNVNVFSLLTLKPYEFFTSRRMKGSFKLCSWFHTASSRKAIQDKTGTVTYVPNMLHLASTDLLAVRQPDIFFGTCTPPDEKGFVSLSLGLTYEKDFVEKAKTVILEINENLPRTFGDTHVHVSQVNNFVECHQEIPTLPVAPSSDIEQKIGEHIADLVEDGATIQLGIGAIPNAVGMALRGKKDLGVHTEMFVDSLMHLYEMGVITNRKKAFCKDKFIATFAMGSKKLYDWLHDNVAINLQRGSWVNDPSIIRRNSKMTSINTCLSVDFSGQVCSESVGSFQFSGTGGQSDTAVGAKEGYDGKGKSIIACRSTAKHGHISTIVPFLPQGSAITLHRSNTDYVVTEYGVASLRGRTVEERTKALIGIAHPKFREYLTEEAERIGYV